MIIIAFVALLIQSNLVTFQSNAQSNFLCPPPPLTFTRGGPHDFDYCKY